MYLTTAVMVATWIVLGLYIRWVVKSGYEDTLQFTEDELA